MIRSILCGLVCAALSYSAPSVTKVEPPNWWIRHTRNPIQVMLTGSDLIGASVSTAAHGFRVEARRISANGHYLFLYLTIGPSVRPGTYRFDVKSPLGNTQFDFPLNAPLDPNGSFQGFSPDDVIYLLMPDRFANGETSNDALPGVGRPVDRSSPRALHGGDLRGIRDHLGYLKDLGVTGIWMTPIYRNSLGDYDAYHGYHTVDFYAVEPRFGTMEDLRNLVGEAHKLGLKVVQDQVANHSGPRHPWVADPPTPTWWHGLDRARRLRNNFDIAALADPYSRPKRQALPLEGWFAGTLPDFNQDDPLVADYLIQNALWWIGMTCMDAIRQDTYPYVDRKFWEQWQAAIDRQYPNLMVTGEITASTPAVLSFFEGGEARLGADTKLKSMLDFPLEYAVREVFAQGKPMTLLADILAQDSLYRHPERLVVFPGNHDQPRFLTAAGADISKLMMATTFVLTTRRTVHLYYGDEIAMQGRGDPDNRKDFPGGWPRDAINAFTPEGRVGDAAKVFSFTRSLLHFRADHPALRRGSIANLVINANRYAYVRSAANECVLVVLNRSGSVEPIELGVDDLGWRDGTQFTPFMPGRPAPVVRHGKLVLADPGEINLYWNRSQ
jgi:glycosidase